MSEIIHVENSMNVKAHHPDYHSDGTALASGLSFSFRVLDSAGSEVSGSWPVAMAEDPSGYYVGELPSTVTATLTPGSSYVIEVSESTNAQTLKRLAVAAERTGFTPSQGALRKILLEDGLGWDVAIA